MLRVDRISIQLGGKIMKDARERELEERRWAWSPALRLSSRPAPCALGASCFSSSPSLRLPSPGHRMSSALPSPLAEAIGRKLSTWKGWVQRGKTQNCMFRMMDVMQSMLTARKKKKKAGRQRGRPRLRTACSCASQSPAGPLEEGD